MKLFHNIGESPSPKPHIASNYNTREEILNSVGPISFDGIYKNVYQNQDVLEGKDIIFFVMGDFVGKDNSFDIGMPLEQYCTWDEIIEMAKKFDAEIGWHTWSHVDLTQLNYEQIIREVKPPFPMKSFAYPSGRFNDEVIRALKEVGFERAYGVFKGDGTPYQITRQYIL